ncbi:hypothetical protein CEXT_429061 [Caerostris extrusa]|uniref:Uncharacterized protein n=1 Tax=Caerostris extrusa TaxID=172846 RepID=A0AAV4PLL5_CAEEX|nr:hypothetical protein CEXT_429061 [Caerostris extrusa]
MKSARQKRVIYGINKEGVSKICRILTESCFFGVNKKKITEKAPVANIKIQIVKLEKNLRDLSTMPPSLKDFVEGIFIYYWWVVRGLGNMNIEVTFATQTNLNDGRRNHGDGGLRETLGEADQSSFGSRSNGGLVIYVQDMREPVLMHAVRIVVFEAGVDRG